RRWHWGWFACGFVVMFVGLLVFYPVLAMHPSGQSLVREPLWMFYADALPRVFATTTTLGPASSNADMLGGVVLEHLALSALGGGGRRGRPNGALRRTAAAGRHFGVWSPECDSSRWTRTRDTWPNFGSSLAAWPGSSPSRRELRLPAVRPGSASYPSPLSP